MHSKLAIKEAAKSRHKQHRLGAVIVRGGKPIAVAHNHSHVHAEHAAIGKAWRNGADGATLIVVRIRKDGSLGLAKPCKMCVDRLIEAKVKKIIYSCSDGTFRCEKLPSNTCSQPINVKFRNLMWYKEK